ncbi:MAG: DJ-1/PfpI family protein [Eubacteriaceae bacterium]
MKQYKVGILLFNEVEVLDFAGPYEVFSITINPGADDKPFIVNTVSQTGGIITARGGLKILSDYSFNNSPCFDILIVPGGYGAEHIEIHNNILMHWIKTQAENAEIVASVCTGAFLLAQACLLDNKRAVTHWMDSDRLQREYNKITVLQGEKYVDETTVITSAGISSGIDMCLHIVSKLLNPDAAETAAKRMEYNFNNELILNLHK